MPTFSSKRTLLLFAVAFAAVGGYLLWRSFAAGSVTLSAENLDTLRSPGTTKVVESARGKRNFTVLEIAGGETNQATISKPVPAGEYKACFIGVKHSPSTSPNPTGTFSAKEFLTSTGTEPPGASAKSFTVSNTSKYTEVGCLGPFTHSDGGQNVVAFYITNTVANSLLRVSLVILETGSTTPPPPPPPPPSSSCSDVTHGQQVSAANTGVQNGATLRPSGSIVTSSDGQIIENVEVSGAISVRHKNVTIRNVRVKGMTDGNGIDTPISYAGQTGGLLVEHVEIIGVSGNRGAGFLAYSPATVRCTEVTGFQDGFKLTSGQVFENNYCHDLYKAIINGSSTHNDCMQAVAAENFTIRKNRFDGPYKQSTSAIILKTDKGYIRNGTMEDNWFSGGSYTIYARQHNTGDWPAPSGLVMRNNIWQKNSWTSGPLSTDGSPFSVWQNNRFDDGTAFNL